MQLKVDIKLLCNALDNIGKAITRRTTNPALDLFYFLLKPGFLTIIGTDSEVFIQTSIPVDSKPGMNAQFYISAYLLLNGIKSLDKCDITISCDSTLCTVSYPSGQFAIPFYYDFQGYPNVPEIKRPETEFNTPCVPIMQACAQLTAFIDPSKADLYPNLAGVHFKINDQQDGRKLDIVATDSLILGFYSSFVSNEIPSSSMTVSLKAASILSSIMKKESTDNSVANICFDSSNVCIQFDNYTVTARLIEKKYPDYNRVIPSHTPCKLVIDRQNLISALKRLMIITDKGSDVVIDIRPGEICLKGHNLLFNQHSEETVIADYNDTETKVCFDASKLLTILNAINAPTVSLVFRDGKTPFIILPHDSEDENKTFLLMSKVIS